MKQTDILIIGAGLLGCFAARALSRYDLDVTVLEAQEDVCTGISRANTGIIYAGYDTKPGTLKTQLCVRANAGFDALCRELDVPFSRCGSLMVSLGAVTAANLDGGASSDMYYRGEYLNPSNGAAGPRPIPTILMVMPAGELTE